MVWLIYSQKSKVATSGHLPYTVYPRTHICIPACPHTRLLFLCPCTVCTSSSGEADSVIAASVAWTDRRTEDWRWHAPIISRPSAVFAITKGLAEHTESDWDPLFRSHFKSIWLHSFYWLGPKQHWAGPLREPDNHFWWVLAFAFVSRCLYQQSYKLSVFCFVLFFLCTSSSQAAR